MSAKPESQPVPPTAGDNHEVNTSEVDPVVAEHHKRRFFPLFKRRNAKKAEEADAEGSLDADGKPKKARKERKFKRERKPKEEKPEQNPATYPSAAAPFDGQPGDEVKDICLEYYGGMLRGVARPVREIVEGQLHFDTYMERITTGELKQRKKVMRAEEKGLIVLMKAHSRAVRAESKREEREKAEGRGRGRRRRRRAPRRAPA
ncbi:hypothetical protein STCU_11303 [Strigomonas culicis]|uniref:Uncharacterized protein n=1 Tax=Strigomonas culicis TaxID=28005 RepID=S9TEC4_9TRYP|nr:hypothetical protein STCU_11303 [Strigomonas culicis]|eukprot:EPY16407.1 hypothetical protein STCU_11303 [Strigomonas culicis]